MSREAMERRTCRHRRYVASCPVCVRAAKQPPKRLCEKCGGEFYAWAGVLCPGCVRFIAVRPAETLREFRRRVIDPTRNHRLQDS